MGNLYIHKDTKSIAYNYLSIMPLMCSLWWSERRDRSWVVDNPSDGVRENPCKGFVLTLAWVGFPPLARVTE